MTPDIQTSSGNYFHFLHPRLSLLSIEDVANSLSKLCRYTGHCREFYSVAQHAVLASYLVAPEIAYRTLHHDDGESVLGDVSSPLKSLLPDYRAIERPVERAIWEKFGILGDMPPEVKRADLRMLVTEKRDLMPHNDGFAVIDNGIDKPYLGKVEAGMQWAIVEGILPAELPIRPVEWREAREMFLARHFELVNAPFREAA